jgi:hypothetical protein
VGLRLTADEALWGCREYSGANEVVVLALVKPSRVSSSSDASCQVLIQRSLRRRASWSTMSMDHALQESYPCGLGGRCLDTLIEVAEHYQRV